VPLRIYRGFVLPLAVVVWALAAGCGGAEAQTYRVIPVQATTSPGKYPMVFTSVNELKRLGIALDLNGEKQIHFRARCYYYGDGGWDISVSEDFLSHYKSKGFSRRSLCLALVSGIRFNPETGARLATYILINDLEAVRTGAVESGSLSDELPISIPDCFRNGVPYSDCAWNYDPLSGRRLNAEVTDEYKRIGIRLDNRLASGTNDSAGKCRGAEVNGASGEYIGVGDWTPLKGALCQPSGSGALYEGKGKSEASFYDYSKEFPGGFGYALYADGTAGPEAPADVVRAALSGTKEKPQIDPAELKAIWGSGSR
jgi:hypothetical protein